MSDIYILFLQVNLLFPFYYFKSKTYYSILFKLVIELGYKRMAKKYRLGSERKAGALQVAENLKDHLSIIIFLIIINFVVFDFR